MQETNALSSPPLESVLRHQTLDTLFQPLFDASGTQVYGHEALTRGPPGTPLAAPVDLLAEAQALGRSTELDLLMIALAIRRFAASNAPGRLFLNVLPTTLVGHADLPTHISALLDGSRLRHQDLVIEVTEHGLADDVSLIQNRVQPLRRAGCEIAIDDLGAGSSGLKIWSALRPDYVKIDRYFTGQLDRDPVVAEILRSMLDMAHVMGSRVVAEGVENAQQMAMLQDLGVDYLQGYHLAKPKRQPRADAAHPPRAERLEASLAASCAEELLVERRAIDPATRIEQVAALFQQNADWDSIAVVCGTKPVGIVRRDALLTLLSKPLYPEVYNRKPVERVMDATPLVVNARARLDQVSRLVTDARHQRINEDFIISRHGEYLGMGRTIELLRQITAQQVQAAKQSNPLTLLPGNREIESQLSRLMALRVPFVLCHGDLDHFKSFNDEYGYRQGDQVLLHVSDLFRRAAMQTIDFVGHLGGDDYILMLRAPDWRSRVNQLFDSFSASIHNFYSAEHRQSGALIGQDRDGQPRTFPLMTLSIGAVEVHPDRFADPEAVMQSLRRTKSAAKSRVGHALVVDGEGEVPLQERQPVPHRGA